MTTEAPSTAQPVPACVDLPAAVASPDEPMAGSVMPPAREASVVLNPASCDVCGQELPAADDYAVVSIIVDRTPRELRSARGSGFIEQEWRLDPVCAECYRTLEAWLFSARDSDTLPAPPPLPVDSGAEPPKLHDVEGRDPEDELGPLAAPAPNRS